MKAANEQLGFTHPDLPEWRHFSFAFLTGPLERVEGALSSRNAYLTAEQRAQGLGLSAALRAADRAWQGGASDAAALVRIMETECARFPGLVPDYIAAVDPIRLLPVSRAEPGTILTLAGRVGTTRLLDNHILGRVFA